MITGEEMTIELAQRIRNMRVDLHYTWRRVAVEVLNINNQLIGFDLCEEAATLLGENAFIKPWN